MVVCPLMLVLWAVIRTGRHQIHRVIGGIDDWSAHDSFLREPERGTAGQIHSAGRSSAVEHAGIPELSACIGVNGIDGICLSHDIDDIVRALSRNIHVGHVKRLGHYDVVDGNTEESSKPVLVNVAGSEQSFIGVGAIASIITSARHKRLLCE